MAQQDKTDWYWNGVLAGAVNNLYYDFINVDVVHVPYVTTHRNSSFFLQTRKNYYSSSDWETGFNLWKDWDVVDVKYIRNDSCTRTTGKAYLLLVNKDRTKMRIFDGDIVDGCLQSINWNRDKIERDISGCGAYRLFTTNYVKGESLSPTNIKEDTGIGTKDPHPFGIQINKYEGGRTHGLFSDTNIENKSERFVNYSIGDYILVYESQNREGDGFAGQVRMITGKDGERFMVDEPWQGFKTLSGDSEEKEVKGDGLSYKIFHEWGEVLGYTEGKNIYILPNANATADLKVYDQKGLPGVHTKIISVAEACEKIYILTDNGYIHYSNYEGVDKFFVQDDMFAGVDKVSLISYRDIIIAFGKRHIAVGVPDENNTYTTMYNQSTTIGLWSRYSYGEYDGDIVFVSNDKRLLALGVAANTGKYMLEYQDVGQINFNSKLSALVPTDEIYIGADKNDLRVFIQTKSQPYYNYWKHTGHENSDYRANLTNYYENTLTRIIKYDKMFSVFTEDIVQGILLQGAEGGVYFGENGIYLRSPAGVDVKGDENNSSFEYNAYISAYLIENEADWVGGNNSWLASRPKLYNVAKLNRLITTLGPGVYSHNSKIRITSYVKGIGTVYEFSIDGGNNDWLGLITDKYIGEELDDAAKEKIECMLSVLQDSQKAYQPKCPVGDAARVQDLAQQQPWCDDYDDMFVYDRGVCIDDSLFELAPTMPLTTNLGENQNYATQIKIELIGGVGDIISFGGWLGEMYIAPLFTIGPDGEYQLQPNTDC